MNELNTYLDKLEKKGNAGFSLILGGVFLFFFQKGKKELRKGAINITGWPVLRLAFLLKTTKDGG